MKNRISEPRCAGVLLVTVAAIGWALNWPAVKVLLREWPPLFSRGVAGVIAALLLGGVAAARGEALRVPRRAIAPLLLASFTNVFAWMGFSTMALKYLRVSEGAVLVYTMPLWATVFAWLMLGARPARRDVAALLLGFSGIVLLFSGHGFALASGKLIGIVLALSAATLFAMGSVTAKGPLPLAPIARVAWQVAAGCVPMVILGWILERPNLGALTDSGWAALSYMTIFPMGICYLAWFAALNRLPAATAAMGTLVVPVVASIAAAVQLGEPLGKREILAIAFTLAGVALALEAKVRWSMPSASRRASDPVASR
jgi:drug/metabolite transporter (DMT)-like permease